MPRILPISTNDRNNDKSISLGNRRIGFFDGVFCRFQKKAKGRSRISRERNTSNIAPDINRSPVLSCVRMIRKLRLPDYSPEDLWTLPRRGELCRCWCSTTISTVQFQIYSDVRIRDFLTTVLHFYLAADGRIGSGKNYFANIISPVPPPPFDFLINYACVSSLRALNEWFFVSINSWTVGRKSCCCC